MDDDITYRHIADDITYISDRPQRILMSTVRIVIIIMMVMVVMMMMMMMMMIMMMMIC